jgi:tetratricopeptide (TPR) repeat protein
MRSHQTTRIGFTLCLLLFVGCCLRATPVFSQPGARPKIKTHPRESPRKIARRSQSRIQAAPSGISLWVLSDPPLSKVFVNGQLRGETNASGEMELKMSPGTYTVRVGRDGYLAREADLDVLPTPDAQEVEFVLPTAVVTVNVVTDPVGAEVYLNDVYKGTSNSDGLLVIDRITPSQGHKLRAKKIGYTEQSNIPITTYNGQISIKLLADSISVKVNTEPSEAEIYLDDVYKGATTADGGVLIIDQVNPNQSHKLRAKKPGYIEQLRLLYPNSTEASFKLSQDPVALLIKDIRQQIADSNLVKAFENYHQLTAEDAENSELTRLQDLILQTLQARSADTLKRIEPFGLTLQSSEVEELQKLYEQARRWRPGDDGVDTFGKYWHMKAALTKADQTGSPSEREEFKRQAKLSLIDLSQRNLRNMYLVLEFGWAWLRLDDSMAAQKNFTAAQELRPDWAYPYFASGILAMQSGEREVNKKSKLIKYGQAIDSFTKAISRQHDFSRAYALRAIAYAYMKNYPESTASGLQAITIDPKSAFAHFALGFAYFQKGGKAGYRSAKDEFGRALSLGGSELDPATKTSIQQRLTIIAKSIK